MKLNMINLKRLLTEAWPKWPGNNTYEDIAPRRAFRLAAGEDINDIPSWFEEAGKTYDALETEMEKLGCTKEPKNLGLSMTWEHWLQVTGFENLAKEFAAADYSAEPESPFSMWNKNVVANNKSATWKTKDGTMILFVSTLESWDDWMRTGKDGLTVLITKFNPAHPKGGINSCVSNYLWNIGNPVQLTKPNNSTCPKPITKEHRIKLIKDILSEAYAWERQEGKPLPTLAEVQAAYQAKLREDAGNEDPDEKDHKYTDLSDVPAAYNPNDDEFEDDGYMDEAAKPDFKSNTTAYGNHVNKARANSHLIKKDVIVYGIDGSGKGHEITNASDLDKYSKASGGKGWTIKDGDDGSDKDQNNNGYPDSTEGSMNNKNKLHDLYGRIYDFTAHAGDSALELMDDIIDSEGLTEVFERYLDDNAKLSDSEATSLAECFEVIIDECNEEFGEYDEDEYDSIDEYGGQDSNGIHADGPKNPFSDVREKEQMIESFNKRMLGNLHGHEYILREAFKRK